MHTTIPQPAQEPSASYDSSISLDEARAVRWPFDTREPMGTMFDQGTLTRSKLQWAAEKARWPDVRRAAQRLVEELERREAEPRPAPASPPATIALAVQHVAQAPAESPRYGARVIAASAYLTDQETLHGMLLAYYIAMIFAALIASLWSLSNLLRPQPWWLSVGVAGANLAIWVWLSRLIRRQITTARNYRAGRAGEDQVVERLRTALDHRWTIYRNLQLPDRQDDLDLVLVGPGGVWAVQVKATRAPLRVQAGRWEVRRGGRWVAAKPDPGAAGHASGHRAERLLQAQWAHALRRARHRAQRAAAVRPIRGLGDPGVVAVLDRAAGSRPGHALPAAG